MIEAVGLTKKYEGLFLALDNLSLKVDSGEVYCLLGANGAGKTTTINLFLNLIEPTAGSALVNGIDVIKNPLEAKKHVSYMSENVMLYGNFTARQNLEFFARLLEKHDLTKNDYYTLLARVGLEEEAFEKKAKEFSKGMRQKVGIAIAIVKDAPALLLDEPTSGLDPVAGAEFIKIIEEFRACGKAVLMSTHDIFRAKEIADQIGIMREGRLQAKYTRDEFENQNLESLYLDFMCDSGKKSL